MIRRPPRSTRNTLSLHDALPIYLGAKTSWLDNKFRFNVDAFYIDYRDLQVFEFGQTLNFVLASANAKIKGIEFDAMAAPAPWFRVGTTFAYLDGKFTSNPTFAGSTIALDGNALPTAPKVKVRKGVGKGKSVSLRVDIGGRGII